MSDRSGLNWALVGHRSDPITGDPGSVDAHAQHYTATAQNLERAQSNLDNLQSDDLTCSEAVEAILARAREMSGLLQAIEVRYVTIGDALKVYAPSLKEAQRVSAEAVAEATAAAQRKRSSAQAANEAALRYKSFDEAERTRAQEDYYTYKAAAARAQGDIDDAKAKVLAAIASRDEAASGAESRIRSVIDESAVNDTVADKIANFLADAGEVIGNVLKWIWDNIDTICLVLDLIAVVLALTGIGGPVAAVLKVVSTLARGARAISMAKKGVAFLSGVVTGVRTGDWSTALNAGMSLGISFVSAKAGRYLSKKAGALAEGYTKQAVDARNLRLHDKTDDAVENIRKQLILNNVGEKSIETNIAKNAVLPIYHKGASTVDAMFASKNIAAAQSAQVTSGYLSLMKGTDYARVSAYVDQLRHLSTKATIPDSVRDSMATIAREAASDAAGRVVGEAENRIKEAVTDGLTDSHRVKEVVVR